jgi:hypothetical protein
MVSGRVFGLTNFDDGTASDYNGLMAFLQIIEGTQVAATDVGQSVSGTWSHKKYTGSFGTHGVYFAGLLNTVQLDLPGHLGTLTNNNGVTLSTDVPPYVTV